jgi:acyl-CoA hydrolase
MFSDGVLGLHEVGALDEDVPLTASFIFGSRKLYDWLDRNKKVRIMRTEVTNNPGNIERQAQMTSVNAALQVDLYDQANASRMKGKIYSGFGGSTDFIVGALHARGGQAFIATYPPSCPNSTNR